MSIKQKLVKSVRKVLPGSAVHKVEEAYRRSRVKLVSARYGNPARDLRVIAITGTNGKTTTANYMNEILKAAGLKTAMFTTAVIEVAGESKLNDLNMSVGSVAQMQRFFRTAKQANVDYVVLEVTSHSLDQHKLSTVPVETAIMTNLTQDHLDYHKTMENYAAAKAKLLQSQPRFTVLNADDSWFSYFAKFKPTERQLTYGQAPEANVRLVNQQLHNNGSDAELATDDQTIAVHSHLPGLYNLYNLAAAATAALALGISAKAIEKGADALLGVPGRYEHVEGALFDIVIDYAHTPDAMEKLFDAARATTKGRLFVVFGATGDRDKGKRPDMGRIAAEKTDKIFLTDDESYNEDPAAIRAMVMEGIKQAGGEDKTREYPERRDAMAAALAEAQADDTVLITGMGHEQYRIVNGQRLPWNDAAVARELL